MPINPRILILAAAVAAVAVTAADAEDRLRTRAGIGISGKILGVTEDGLVIDDGGRKRTVALPDIARITRADAVPGLGEAEAAYAKGLDGDPKGFEQADKLYAGLLRKRPPAWLKILIQFRMYGLYAESGRVAEAVDAFLTMARTNAKLVEALKLPNPAEGDPANKAMFQRVDEVLRDAGNQPYTVELRTFRLSLMMLEGKPEDVLPLLEPLLKHEDPNVRQRARLKKLELLLVCDRPDEAETTLEAVEEAAGPDQEHDVAYWRGRLLEARGRHKEAALSYMRLPILFPRRDRNRTADALWRAGKTLEAAGVAKDEFVGVYTEAVTQYPGTQGAERAKRELARLESK